MRNFVRNQKSGDHLLYLAPFCKKNSLKALEKSCKYVRETKDEGAKVEKSYVRETKDKEAKGEKSYVRETKGASPPAARPFLQMVPTLTALDRWSRGGEQVFAHKGSTVFLLY